MFEATASGTLSCKEYGQGNRMFSFNVGLTPLKNDRGKEGENIEVKKLTCSYPGANAIGWTCK